MISISLSLRACSSLNNTIQEKLAVFKTHMQSPEPYRIALRVRTFCPYRQRRRRDVVDAAKPFQRARARVSSTLTTNHMCFVACERVPAIQFVYIYYKSAPLFAPPKTFSNSFFFRLSSVCVVQCVDRVWFARACGCCICVYCVDALLGCFCWAHYFEPQIFNAHSVLCCLSFGQHLKNISLVLSGSRSSRALG